MNRTPDFQQALLEAHAEIIRQGNVIERLEANARLIAAAPAMLDALRKIYLGTSEDFTLAIADKAIKEAVGND